MQTTNLLRIARFTSFGAALAVIPLVLLPSTTCGAQTYDRTIVANRSASDNESIDPARLPQVLEKLKELAAHDAGINADRPALDEIVRRVAEDPDSCSSHEKGLFLTLLTEDRNAATGDPNPKDIPRTVRQRLNAQIRAWPQYSFQSIGRNWPNGSSIGVVKFVADGTTRTELEVMSTAYHIAPTDRSAMIVKRLSQLQHANRFWWSELRAVPKGSDYYLTAPGVEGSVIITADSKYAKLWGVHSTKQLAISLIKQIRKGIDRPKLDPNAKDISTEAKRMDAIRYRQSGDEAFSAGDMQGAEQAYKDAIDSSSHYLIPYLRLADYYLKQHRNEERKAILDQALSLSDLPADDRLSLQNERDKVQ